MKRSSVLIIDDEKNIRLTLSHALEKLDLDLDTAVTAEDALDKMKGQRPSLVLLDLKLPGMSGMELLREMRSRHWDTKVLIITAHGTVDYAVEAMKLGAIDFIQKPFTPEEVRDFVSKALERHRKPYLLQPPAPAARQQRQAPATEEEYGYEECLEKVKAAVENLDFSAAIPWAKRAIGTDPTRPEGYNLMGALLEIKLENSLAQKFYRAALAMDPTYESAQKNLSQSAQFQSMEPIRLGEKDTFERLGLARAVSRSKQEIAKEAKKRNGKKK